MASREFDESGWILSPALKGLLWTIAIAVALVVVVPQLYRAATDTSVPRREPDVQLTSYQQLKHQGEVMKP